MGAGVFHGRVRDGIGCINPAMATGPPDRNVVLDLVCFVGCGWVLRAVVTFEGHRAVLCGSSIGRLGPLGSCIAAL